MEKIIAQNVKVLNDEELNILNDSYSFEVQGNMILVKSKSINRVVAHNKKEKFTLNTKISRITIQPLAIQTWEYEFRYLDYSLFEVQNAINKLIVLYQEPSQKDILNILKRKNEKIIKIN